MTKTSQPSSRAVVLRAGAAGSALRLLHGGSGTDGGPRRRRPSTGGRRSSIWRPCFTWTWSDRSTRCLPPYPRWVCSSPTSTPRCTTSSHPPSWCGSRSAGARSIGRRATPSWRPRPSAWSATGCCPRRRRGCSAPGSGHHGRVQRRRLVGPGGQRAAGHGGAEQPVRRTAVAARRLGGVGRAVPLPAQRQPGRAEVGVDLSRADERRCHGDREPLPARCRCRPGLRVRRHLARAPGAGWASRRRPSATLLSAGSQPVGDRPKVSYVGAAAATQDGQVRGAAAQFRVLRAELDRDRRRPASRTRPARRGTCARRWPAGRAAAASRPRRHRARARSGSGGRS